jgi:hypothetical protein
MASACVCVRAHADFTPVWCACCTVHAARCMLHGACCTLHAARCMLHVACCTLHAARCTLHAARCMLHIARCTLSVLQPLRCLQRVDNLRRGRLVLRAVPKLAVPTTTSTTSAWYQCTATLPSKIETCAQRRIRLSANAHSLSAAHAPLASAQAGGAARGDASAHTRRCPKCRLGSSP